MLNSTDAGVVAPASTSPNLTALIDLARLLARHRKLGVADQAEAERWAKKNL